MQFSDNEIIALLFGTSLSEPRGMYVLLQLVLDKDRVLGGSNWSQVIEKEIDSADVIKAKNDKVTLQLYLIAHISFTPNGEINFLKGPVSSAASK